MVKSSEQDQVTVVGAGITLYEALAAYDKLKAEGIMIRVVDPFTLKPIDKDTLVQCARATGGKIVTVEDHYPEGRGRREVCMNIDRYIFNMCTLLACMIHVHACS